MTTRALPLNPKLGAPARWTNWALRLLLSIVGAPLIPVAWLLGLVHTPLVILTFGGYAAVWNVAWLPFYGFVLATSWLWSRLPWIWPLWALVGAPFVIVSYVVALVGPRDPAAPEKLGSIVAWPETYALVFDWETVGYTAATGAGEAGDLASRPRPSSRG
jgi:predicted membrane metal-binding protein